MKTKLYASLAAVLCLLLLCAVCGPVCAAVDVGSDAKAFMASIAGENREITGAYDKACAVQCSNGTFVAKPTADVLSFKGIPFAAQPVGSLRWKAPQPASNSSKVFEAYYFGHSPIQSIWPSERASYYPQGEDCLNLNIWVNRTNSSAKKPVMVFIHGGSFGWGGTADPLYDATALCQKFPDVVFVTVGYRTGLWGFMDFSAVPGGDAYPDSGNLGLLDQVCALEWIRDNIAGFGGNPDNVTIWGESAGGASVSLLPLIKSAKGLFRRVISESGAVNQTSSKEECLNLTRMLLDCSGCTTMAELAAVDTAQLQTWNDKLNDYNNFPERDGRILPMDPYAAYENGEAADVAFLLGTNKDECRYWMQEIGLMAPGLPAKMLYSVCGRVLLENEQRLFSTQEKENLQAFLAMQQDKKLWNLTEYFNENTFRLPAIRQAQANADHGGTVFLYYWTDPSSIPDFGACHAVELSAVFCNLDDTIYTGKPTDSRFADAVQQMWVQFARTGDPSTPDHVWEPYHTDTRKTMVLDRSGIELQSDPMPEQRQLLMPLTDYYLHGSYMTMSLNTPTVWRLALCGGMSLLLLVLLVVLLVRGLKRCRAAKKN